MKRSNFIHYILAVALCLGQVVANAHLISHIGTHAGAPAHNDNHNGAHSGANDHQTNHLSAHAHAHEHPLAHHKESLSVKQSSSDEANSDCAAYHAYAGLAAITPAVCNAIAVGPKLSLVINYHHSNVFIGLAETQPIRGPPIHS